MPWSRWVAEVFGEVEVLEGKHAHELVLLAGARVVREAGDTRCPACVGEMYLDSFKHPKRDIEWFMRCRQCGNTVPAKAEAALA